MKASRGGQESEHRRAVSLYNLNEPHPLAVLISLLIVAAWRTMAPRRKQKA